MDNKEKLETLKAWLIENGYKYKVNVEFVGQQADLMVDYPRIAVHVGDSDEFFRKVKYKAAPFFIRDSETMEFVIEKMTNCISQAIEGKRKRDEERKEREAQKAVHKRKRVRIPRAEKVISGE